MDKKMIIRVDRAIRIRKSDLPEELVGILKEKLIWENPLFLRNARYGRPNHGIDRFLFCIWDDQPNDDLIIARGFFSELARILRGNRISFEVEDHTQKVPGVDFAFHGSLYPYQTEALEALRKRRFGILVGPQGCGKKVITLKLIAERKARALVVTRTRRRFYAWKEAALRFLGDHDHIVGLVGDGQRDVAKPFIVGISLSLYKCLDEFKDRIDFLIIDDCSGANLKIFFKIVMQLKCGHMLSLSRVSKRPDGLTRLMEAYVGPRIHKIDGSLFTPLQRRPGLRINDTGFDYDYRDDYPEMILALTRDQDRNGLIVKDILETTAEAGTRALVVSERIDHLREISRMIQGALVDADMIIGETPEKKREEILGQFHHNKFPVLLATLKTVPGLDVKGVDFLFVICPFKFLDHITQIVGKLLRAGKCERRGVILEYRDKPEILRVSLKRRLKVYGTMGVSSHYRR